MRANGRKLGSGLVWVSVALLAGPSLFAQDVYERRLDTRLKLLRRAQGERSVMSVSSEREKRRSVSYLPLRARRS